MGLTICALLMLLRLKEAHPIRRALSIILTVVLLAFSLSAQDATLGALLLIAASVYCLWPLRAVSSLSFFSLTALLLLFLGVHQGPLLLLASVFFRLLLPTSSTLLVTSLVALPGSQRALFFLSTLTFSWFAASFLSPLLGALMMLFALPCVWFFFQTNNRPFRTLFLAQALTLVPFALIGLSDPKLLSLLLGLLALIVTFIAQSNPLGMALESPAAFQLDRSLFEGLQKFLNRISQVARHFLGPIASEGLFLLLPAASLVLSRWLIRLLSYASFPRLLASSLFVSFVILVFILRL